MMAAAGIEPRAIITIPAGAAGNARAYCLRVTDVISVSQDTGALQLIGYKLDADGASKRRIPRPAVVTVAPDQVSVLRRADEYVTPLVHMDIRPGPTQVAVTNLPAGITARLHVVVDGHEVVREKVDADHPMVLVVPGNRDWIGWGALLVRHGEYDGLRGVRNHQHKRDRAVWHEAARRLDDGGVVYVQLAQRNWYGRMIWVAVDVLDGPELPEV